MRNILVIDGQGGKLGRLLVESLRQSGTYHITAVGTNAIATSNMRRRRGKMPCGCAADGRT